MCTKCTTKMSVGPAVTIPVKGPSRTWHVPPASSQAGSLRLCCRTGRQHPARDPGGCKEPFPHPEAALKPQTEETLKVMDRWVSGARLFSTFFLLLAQMDWPSFRVTARHTQHASSGLPILPPHPQFWGPGPFLSPAVPALCPATSQAEQGCLHPLEPTRRHFGGQTTKTLKRSTEPFRAIASPNPTMVGHLHGWL